MIAESFRRVWYLLNRRRFEAQLRDEIAAHRAELNDARDLGSALRIHEDVRMVWGWSWMDSIVGDVRQAARSLRRNASFTVTTIASLAIGLGLTATTTAIINAYGVKALPYPDAERLYNVMYAPPGPWEPRGVSQIRWNDLKGVVAQAITASGTRLFLPDAGTDPIRAMRVDSGFVTGLGVAPALGRALDQRDYRTDAEPVAMLGYALWRTRFAGDSSVIGRLLRATDEDDRPIDSYRIVGVLPARFYFGRDSRDTVGMLLPLRTARQTYMVRLHEGVTPRFAEDRITAAARAVASDIPADWTGVHLESVHGRYVEPVKTVLHTVRLASIIVLVIVCVNVTILALLRSVRRQKEVAVRAALGASRLRLARGPAIESLLLCFSGLALAFVAAEVTLTVFAQNIATQLGRPAPQGADTLTVDVGTVIGTSLAAVLVAFVLSVVPLAVSSRERLATMLRSSSRASHAGPTASRARAMLLVVEIGASVCLLIACGLMLRSTLNVVRTDRGFAPSGVVRTRLSYPPRSTFASTQGFLAFYDAIRAEARARSGSPLVFSMWPPYAESPKQRVENEAGTSLEGGVIQVSEDYFGTMGIPLRAGRDFQSTDRPGGALTAIVSATIANRLWPSGDAIGKQVRLKNETAHDSIASPWLTVVGFVGDVRQSFADDDLGDLYTSYMNVTPSGFATVYSRSTRSATEWGTLLRAQAARLNPRITVGPATALVEGDREGAEAHFLATLLTTFAVFTTLLTAVGILGVTAYAVQQRAREMAVRMALGASARSITRLYITSGSRALLAGLVIGVIAAVNGARLIAHQVYGVSALDIPTYAGACVVMSAVAMLALWRPAQLAASEANIVLLRDSD